MRDITDLDNFIAPDDDNAFGRLKDTIYVGGAVSEVGSRIFADWIMDLLSIPYFIAAKNGTALNGVADDTAASQAYDLVFGEVTDYLNAKIDPVARQLALGAWGSKSNTSIGAPSTVDFSSSAGANGIFLFQYFAGFAKVIVWNNGRSLGDYQISTYAPEEENKRNLIHDGTKFCSSSYTPSPSFSPQFYSSTDGTSWAATAYDSSTARGGGVVIEKIGSTLVIVAYNDPDNSYYTSSDGGLNWIRGSLTVTSPLYKPVVSASSDTDMVWVDESGQFVRHFDGGLWSTCVLNGGTLSTGEKQIVYSGNRFVILDKGNRTMFLSRESDPTTFDIFEVPRPDFVSGLDPLENVLLGGDGVITVGYGLLVYSTTEANALSNKWVLQPGIPESGSPGIYPTTGSFDGTRFAVGSRDQSTGNSAIVRYTQAVQL